MCYFWIENLSNLCELIVCGSQTLRSTHGPPTGFGFQNIGLPNLVLGYSRKYSPSRPMDDTELGTQILQDFQERQ